MWSGPRNISTAMMYSFDQRQDTQVLDEPFFGCFLEKTGLWRPSREEVLKNMELSPSKVLKEISAFDSSPNLFLKNMANHIEVIDLKEIESFKNIILLRDPKKVLNSFSKHIEIPSQVDLGYIHQIKIIEHLDKKGLPFIIINSDDVCDFPENELQKICDYLEIDFDGNMLKWKAGPIKEDGVWAKYWYHNVHKSTGFSPTKNTNIVLKKELKEIYEEANIHYTKIVNYHE